MGRWMRLVVLLVPAVVCLLMARGVAWADPVEDDPVVDLADMEDDGVTTRACGDWPDGPPGDENRYVPDVANVTYRTINEVPPLYLKVDVYRPNSGGNFAALVVVHGGGWFTGCKEWSAIFAGDAAIGVSPSPGFLVFNINYRLSCSDAEDEVIAPYCGHEFAAPANDVEYAIAWVNDHADEYEAAGKTFNGNVAVFGSSAGGNLAFEAGMHASGNSKPDAVAGWSGAPDIGFLSDNEPSCDHSVDPDYCNTSAEWYTGCPLQGPGSCESTWDDASPINWVGGGEPPTFISQWLD